MHSHQNIMPSLFAIGLFLCCAIAVSADEPQASNPRGEIDFENLSPEDVARYAVMSRFLRNSTLLRQLALPHDDLTAVFGDAEPSESSKFQGLIVAQILSSRIERIKVGERIKLADGTTRKATSKDINERRVLLRRFDLENKNPIDAPPVVVVRSGNRWKVDLTIDIERRMQERKVKRTRPEN